MLSFWGVLALEDTGVLERGSVDFLDDQLGNRHSRTKDKICRPQVDDLQRQCTIKSWMHGGRREMDQDPATRHTAPALNPCREACPLLPIDRMIQGKIDVFQCFP